MLPEGSAGRRKRTAEMSTSKGQQAGKAGSLRQMLSAVPHHNHAMKIEPRREGRLLATVPIRRPRYLVPPISWIVPFSPHRRVELDRVGASVLKLCDGKRNTEGIIEEFARQHRLSFRESQLAVT